MQLWCILWRFPLAFHLGNFVAKLYLLWVFIISLSTHMCLWFFAPTCSTRQQGQLLKNIISLWDRRSISPWMIWLAPIWKCIVCFTYSGLGLKSSRLPTLRRVRMKSIGAMDISPNNHRRKEIEIKLSSTFHLKFYLFSAEYSLCAKIIIDAPKC